MKKVLLIIFSVLLVSFSFSAYSAEKPAAEKVTVFAAASMTNVMDEVLAIYNKNGGNAVGSYDSSGNLARGIKQGAPAAIFISADQKWMNELEKEGMLEAGTRVNLVGNSIVLIAKADSQFKEIDLTKKPDIAGMLGKDRLAIGNPESVPNGTYAKEGFIKLGIWDSIANKLAMTQNVRVALKYVSTGEAPLGVVFGTDAAADKNVKVLAVFPKGTTADVSYPSAIIKGKASAEAKKLYEFLKSPEVKAIYKNYGFSVE